MQKSNDLNKPSTNPAALRSFRRWLKVVPLGLARPTQVHQTIILCPKPAHGGADISPGRNSTCRGDLCFLPLYASRCALAKSFPAASSGIGFHHRKRNPRVQEVKPTHPKGLWSTQVWSQLKTHSYSGETHSEADFSISGYWLAVLRMKTRETQSLSVFLTPITDSTGVRVLTACRLGRLVFFINLI